MTEPANKIVDMSSMSVESSAANDQAGLLVAPGSSILVSEHGRTIIHGDVVAKIAGMAVREVDGVHALVPQGAGQRVTALARKVVGATMRDLGIQVEVGKIQAAVDVRVITEYGASIVEVAKGVRTNVRERVEWMTGLEVVEVNIEVVDLFFPDAPRDGNGIARTRVE